MQILQLSYGIVMFLQPRNTLNTRKFLILFYDGLVKSSNSRRANFVIMKRTYSTLNDCEMQHNAEVGLFTRPSFYCYLCFVVDIIS